MLDLVLYLVLKQYANPEEIRMSANAFSQHYISIDMYT